MDSLKNRVARLKSREEGFSLIDVVVTVAIIVALSVGGFVSYNGIVNNAKQGAVDYAASNVYRSAIVMENDGEDDTDACTAIDRYNQTSDGIAVSLIVPNGNGEVSVDASGKVTNANIYYGKNPGTDKQGHIIKGEDGQPRTNSYTC